MTVHSSFSLCSRPMLPAILLVLSAAVGSAQAIQFAGSIGTMGSGFEYPQGMAVDLSGNVYVADSSAGSVFKIPPGCQSQACQSIIANDLNQPSGLAVDPVGNLYIADSGNSRVLKLPPGCAQDSCATTVGNGFSCPQGVAIDPWGYVYITDNGTNLVWKITSAAGKIVWAGGEVSNLTDPTGIVFDSDGYGYIAETGKNDVVQIPPNCVTAACQVIEGTGLNRPTFLSVSTVTNTIYISDSGNGRIVSLSPGHQQTLVISGLNNPTGIAIGNGASLYEIDASSKGRVNLLDLNSANFAAAQVGAQGNTHTLNFSFSEQTTIGRIAVLTSGQTSLDFVDTGTGTCKSSVAYSPNESCTVDIQFDPAMPGVRRGAVEVFDQAGVLQGSGLVDGTGLAPLLVFDTPLTPVSIGGSWNLPPVGSVADAAGNLFVIAANNTPYYDPNINNDQPGQGEIVMIPPGCANVSCETVLPGTWNVLTSIALDGAGNLYVAETDAVTTYYGPATAVTVTKLYAAGGYANREVVFDDTQTATDVDSGILPVSAAIAVDASGNLFVTETIKHFPYRRTPYTVGKILIRLSLGNNQYGPATPYPTILTSPHAPTLDAAGTLYLVDGNSVFSIASGGSKTPLGQGFIAPSGLTIDAAGTLYVADQGKLWKVPPGCNSEACEMMIQQGFAPNATLAIDDNGNLFVSDVAGSQFLEVPRGSLPPLSFEDTYIGELSSDSPRNITVGNVGNEQLTFAGGEIQNPSFPRGFPETVVPDGCRPFISVQPGSTCGVSVSFAPFAAGTAQANVTLLDNSLNQFLTAQNIPVRGQGLKLLQTVTFLLPPTVAFGAAPIPLIAVCTSKLPVTFAVLSGPAVINGTSLLITGAGTVLVAAYQSGNDVYAAAPTVTQTVQVSKATPHLSWTTPAPILYGVPLSSTQLDALPSVPGTIVYTPTKGTILPAGTHLLTATFTPLDSTDYNSTTSTVSLQVTADSIRVVTGSVAVAEGALVYDSRTGRGHQVITITNTSSSPITGPIALALSISGPATSANASGTFGGNPYWTVRSGALGPGASATIHVAFSYASGASFTTTPIVYSGTL